MHSSSEEQETVQTPLKATSGALNEAVSPPKWNSTEGYFWRIKPTAKNEKWSLSPLKACKYQILYHNFFSDKISTGLAPYLPGAQQYCRLYRELYSRLVGEQTIEIP